jgi:hypothetical protein
MDPPMAKPEAARRRLMPISGIRVPSRINDIAVTTTFVGAGKM